MRSRALTAATPCGRAQISVPGLASGARRRGERLAMLVGACEAAEIRALAGAHAGHEERHARLLRQDAIGNCDGSNGRGREESDRSKLHFFLQNESPARRHADPSEYVKQQERDCIPGVYEDCRQPSREGRARLARDYSRSKVREC